MLQILEIALVDGMDKESDLSQSCSANTLIDSFQIFAAVKGSIDLQDHMKCMLQGIDYLCQTLLFSRIRYIEHS